MNYRKLHATGSAPVNVSFREPVNLVNKTLNKVVNTDLSSEIASRSRSMDLWVMGAMLPNPDEVLKRLGMDIKVYQTLKSDASVGGAIRRRKASVRAMERGFKEKCNPKVKELLETAFDNLDMPNIIDNILEAPLLGYQPMEVMWDSSTWLPTNVVAKPQHWFGFDNDNQLRLRTRENMLTGELLPERKFLLPRKDASYVNPYGLADLSMCYWAVVFKKGGLKFWVTFAEKYGTPWLLGKHPRGATQNDINKLLDSLDALFGDAVGVIPDDNSIEIKDAVSKNATTEIFKELIDMCKGEINIALLGQNQTTENSSNRASAQAGLQVTEDIRDGDAQLVMQTLTKLARWIVDLHFGEDEYCPPYQLWNQEEVDDKQAKRDENLKKAGANLSNQYFQRSYQLEDGDLLPQTPTTTAMPNFAEMQFGEVKPSVDWTDKVSGQLAATANPVIHDWLGRIKALLDSHEREGKNLNEFGDSLLNEFSELSTEELTKVMELGLLAGELAGRGEVVNETGMN